jgi:hypothetical protein
MVPEPNRCEWPVTVRPPRDCSVVMLPLPKGCVRVVVPSDQRVMVLEPNGCVWPVIDFPSRDRSVVMLPLPKGCVRLEEPSERWVSVPEPNFCVVPDRGALWPARGGVGSAACTNCRHPAAKRHSVPSRIP